MALPASQGKHLAGAEFVSFQSGVMQPAAAPLPRLRARSGSVLSSTSDCKFQQCQYSATGSRWAPR